MLMHIDDEQLEYLQKREYEITINYRIKTNYWNGKQGQNKPNIYNEMEATFFKCNCYYINFTLLEHMK